MAAPFMGAVKKPLLNYNVGIAALIRQRVDIPIIVVGGIRNLRDIVSIVLEKNIVHVHEPAVHH
jgi:imidazole glycerol phosphate synthase subunit HisF